MKKMFVLSMLISLATICSCQKQDSTVEAQLAQRKTELDSREDAVIQREKAVDAREKAVAEKEKSVANGGIIQPRTQPPDAAQAEADRQRRIQQLPPELRALIPDRSRLDAQRTAKDPTQQQRAGRTSRSVEDALRKKGMSSVIASPEADVPQAEATSPFPSPTP